MFEVGWTEMLVIAIVLIVVVGPKDLPRMLRTFGKTTAKLRAMAGDFRKQFDEALKEAELDDVKTLASDMRKLNPAADIRKALSPMQKAAEDLRAGVDAAMKPQAKPDTSAQPAPADAPPAELLKAGATALPAELTAAKAKGHEAAAATPQPAAKSKPATAPAKAAKAATPAVKAAASTKPAKAPVKKRAAASAAKTGGKS